MVQQQQQKLENLPEESGDSFPWVVQESVRGPRTTKDVTDHGQRGHSTWRRSSTHVLSRWVGSEGLRTILLYRTLCLRVFHNQPKETNDTCYHFCVPSHHLAIQTPSWTWHIYWKMANLALLNKHTQDLGVNLWVDNPGSSLGSGTPEPGD